MKTSVYICADGTLTYGPYGGKRKIIKQALPIAIVDDEAAAQLLILSVGRRAYDDPRADPDFSQTLRGRPIEPGYGPDHRYYYSGPEFVRGDVDTLWPVRQAVKAIVARQKGDGSP